MGIQDAGKLRAVAPSMLPLLVDRLNDVKDRYRELAMNSLVEYWKACPSEVEKTIKDLGFGSKSWRIREQVLKQLDPPVAASVNCRCLTYCLHFVALTVMVVNEVVGQCPSITE